MIMIHPGRFLKILRRSTNYKIHPNTAAEKTDNNNQDANPSQNTSERNQGASGGVMVSKLD